MIIRLNILYSTLSEAKPHKTFQTKYKIKAKTKFKLWVCRTLLCTIYNNNFKSKQFTPLKHGSTLYNIMLLQVA